MKSNHYYKIHLFIKFVLILSFFEANANEVIEDKVKKLTLELRCMTCQNQSIYDSDAEFSNDIKNIIRKKFKEGKSEDEIKKFLVKRYGEYILFRPLINYNNFFLWAFPFTLLTISLIFWLFKSRKK